MREWKELTKDEREIITTMKMQGITPEELLQRMRNSGKMNDQAIEGLKKALEEVKPFFVH